MLYKLTHFHFCILPILFILRILHLTFDLCYDMMNMLGRLWPSLFFLIEKELSYE